MQTNESHSPIDESNSGNNGTRTNKRSTKSQKVVKNFNEFLNFASINKSRISDRLTGYNSGSNLQIQLNKIGSNDDKLNPIIKLTKSSFDDSDPSSATETPPHATQTDSSEIRKPLQLQLSNILTEKQTSFDGSSPDDSQEYFPMTTSMTRELRLELENLDRQVFGTDFHQRTQFNVISGCETPESGDSIDKMPEFIYKKLNQTSVDCYETDSDHGVYESINVTCAKNTNMNENVSDICSYPVRANGDVKCRVKSTEFYENKHFKRISTSSANNDIFIWENPLHQFSSSPYTNENDNVRNKDLTTPDEQCDLDFDGEIIEENNLGKKSVTPIRLVRKNGSSTNNSNRNSILNDIDSDTSDSWNDNQNGIELGPNPVEINNKIGSLIPNCQNAMTNSCEEASEMQSVESQDINKESGCLPPPKEFGCGNPFLMFLCLTILLQHRDIVMKSGMDYNEMAMHFDKMVRKHNVTRVLNQARRMYAEYLKSQKTSLKCDDSVKISNINNPSTMMTSANPSATDNVNT